MSVIAVAAFFGLVALPRATMPLADGDVWWHLRAGEAVLSTRSVPSVDTWTLVGSGMRWISQDWLSNTLMAAILRVGGGLGYGLAKQPDSLVTADRIARADGATSERGAEA